MAEIAKLNLLSNERLESSRGALWLGIRTFFCSIVCLFWLCSPLIKYGADPLDFRMISNIIKKEPVNKWIAARSRRGEVLVTGDVGYSKAGR